MKQKQIIRKRRTNNKTIIILTILRSKTNTQINNVLMHNKTHTQLILDLKQEKQTAH